MDKIRGLSRQLSPEERIGMNFIAKGWRDGTNERSPAHRLEGWTCYRLKIPWLWWMTAIGPKWDPSTPNCHGSAGKNSQTVRAWAILIRKN